MSRRAPGADRSPTPNPAGSTPAAGAIRRVDVTTPADIRAEIERLADQYPGTALLDLLDWLDEPMAVEVDEPADDPEARP